MGYEIVVDSGKEDGIKEPEFMKTVDRFSYEFNKEFGDVLGVSSLALRIKEFNQAMHQNSKEYYKIPSNSNEIAQYLLLYSMSLPSGMEINDRVDIDNRYLRVTC